MTSSMQGHAMTGVNGAPGQGQQLQQAATGLLDQAARTADAQASTRMTMMGETLDGVARAIQDSAAQLRERQPEIAGWVETGATRLDDIATYLRDHTASEALENVQQIARRRPALIVGGGLAAGLLIGRFLRTGASAARGGGASQQGGGRYGSGEYGAGRYGDGQDTIGQYGGAGVDDARPDRAAQLAATNVAVHPSADDADLVVDVEHIDDLGQPEATTGRTRGGAR